MIKYNSLPSYFANHHYVRSISGELRTTPHVFDIYEVRNNEVCFICSLSNRGDRLNNILKRGIPLDQARKIFYEIDYVS